MKKALILFAKGFPYNVSEPFLENEYPIYREYFDKVLIVTGCKKKEKPTRVINDPTIEIVCDYILGKDIPSIIQALPALLTDGMFYKEINSLFKQKRFSLKSFYQLLVLSLCGNHRALLAKKWLREHPEYQVNVVYSYWLQITAYAAVRLNKIALRGKAYTVSRAHGFDLYEERMATNYLPFQRQVVNELSEIASISDDGKNYLIRKYQQSNKITICHLGALDRKIKNPDAERMPLRVVSCARTVPIKRLDRLAEAFMQIYDLQVEWTHIGGGSELEKLKSIASNLPSNIQTHFTGTVSNMQVYETYANTPFHCFVNVSKSEGVPVSIMEAMSFHIPVIATAVGGTAELVDENKNGFLLNENYSDTELVQLLHRFAEMQENEYQAFRENARTKFLREYNALPNYRRFVEHLAEKDKTVGIL